MNIDLNFVLILKNLIIAFVLLSPCSTSADIEWPDQLAGIEYNLAEVGYQVNQSDSSRGRLIFATEQLINKHCIREISPNFHSLKEDGHTKCKGILKKLTEIDPDNPIIICSKTGYTSQQCVDMFSTIKLQSLSDYGNLIGDKDVEAALALANEDPNKENEDLKLNSLRQAFYSKTNPNAQQQMIPILRSRIKRYCGVVRYHVTAIPIQPTTPPTAKPQGTQKPFQEMLDQLTQKATPTPNTIGPTRIRLVSPQCLDAVNSLKKIEPANTDVVCVEKGYFSPQCLRIQRSQNRSTTTGGKGNSGFDPF